MPLYVAAFTLPDNQTLPSGIYSAFHRTLAVPDVLDAYNDVDLRWMAYDNWTYTNKFKCECSLDIQCSYNMII